jgi:hypothetical protein
MIVLPGVEFKPSDDDKQRLPGRKNNNRRIHSLFPDCYLKRGHRHSRVVRESLDRGPHSPYPESGERFIRRMWHAFRGQNHVKVIRFPVPRALRRTALIPPHSADPAAQR